MNEDFADGSRRIEQRGLCKQNCEELTKLFLLTGYNTAPKNNCHDASISILY